MSRLSPPLMRSRRWPRSSRCIRDRGRAAAWRCGQYAARQGRDLAALGVNLNFAPVVDLNHGVVNPEDRLSRISSRAISADPAVVTEVAGLYCATLMQTGVHCTLKHFPGLGRVYEDTHKVTAELSARAARTRGVGLAAVPASDGGGRRLHDARATRASPQIDRDRPASFSDAVVRGCCARTGSTTAFW